MVDVTQTMACIQCGACVSDCLSMEVDPLFIGPAALAKAYRFVGDPRDGQHHERLKDLAEDPHGIYDCTHCFNCIDACPKGVAPMSQIMRLRRLAGRRGDQRPQQRPSPREGVRGEHRARTGCSTRPTCCPTPTAATLRQVPPAGGPELVELAAGRSRRRCCARKVTPEGRCSTRTSCPGDFKEVQQDLTTRSRTATSGSSSTSTSPAIEDGAASEERRGRGRREGPHE